MKNSEKMSLESHKVQQKLGLKYLKSIDSIFFSLKPNGNFKGTLGMTPLRNFVIYLYGHGVPLVHLWPGQALVTSL